MSKHNTLETGVWVTYKEGVYDMSDFIAQHPGGANKLLLAAGGAIDPFWAMYQQHNVPEVKKILAGYRIGTLKGYEASAQQLADPYVNEPSRLPALVVRSARPFNAETPPEVLADALITPNALFYVRHHLPVPVIDEASYKLVIDGEGMRTLELSLDDLKTRFRKHSVAATIQCAGNRRDTLNDVQEVKGLAWDAGAISTAVWSGVKLRDVLLMAGLDPSDLGAVEHIQFDGHDVDMEGACYGASIPVKKALDPDGDVLLAYEMNGVPLPRDHGGPVRVVVPGITGARNVKWLARIAASDEESRSFWQRRDYKMFSPATGIEDADWDNAQSIQEMPVQSAICEPANGSVLEEGTEELTVKGYAWSGGGKAVTRVEVSPDGGKTWVDAQLKRVPQAQGKAWAWVLWEAEVKLPKELLTQGQGPGPRQLSLMCKATDDACNTQPGDTRAIWNFRGLNNNAWHRVSVSVA